MKRLLVGLILLVALAPPPPAAAQQGRLPRKVLIAGIGGLVAGGVAAIYAVSFEDGGLGGCSAASCVVPVTVAGGALIGYMIGRELDQLHALRYRSAPPLRVRGRELPLSIAPTDVWYDARTVLVSGEDGLELVRGDATLAPLGLRARGLRGIGPLAADSALNTLFVGTPSGLYRFQLRDEAPGTMAHADEISALAQRGTQLAMGTGPDLALTTVGDSLAAAGPTLFESARVVDLQWSDGLLWALTEDRLVSYRPGIDSATEVGAYEFTALARRFDVHGGRAVVAAGSGGAVVLDIEDPAAPRLVAEWRGAQFAYDAVIRGDSVYVAGGPEGLFLLRVTPEGLTALGLARDMGFVAALAADDEAVYLLDRAGARLRRIRRGAP